MMTLLLLLFALFVPMSTNSAQPAAVECPMPPYQLPLQAPERSFIDETGQLFVDGIDAAVELPEGLTVRHHL